MHSQTRKTQPPPNKGERGQALLEYALILVLVAVALAAALIATGPALGNVFSNAVYNLVGITGTPQDLYARGGPTAFWQTVTAVATNPPPDRGFPTSPPKPPTSTPSPGPSPTPTPITPTPTPLPTNTYTPSPTATDNADTWRAPFYDPINEPAFWRVDSDVYLGGEDWRGEYYPNRDLAGTADHVKYNQEIDPNYLFNLNFDWQDGGPITGWKTDEFSVRYTRSITVGGTQPLQVYVTIRSDDGVRFKVDGTTVAALTDWNARSLTSPPLTSQITLSPGSHTLTVEYQERTGQAGLQVALAVFKANVRDDAALVGGTPVSCQWVRVNGTQPNTVSWAWDESPLANGFPPNMRCHLELRGGIDLVDLTTPSMSFWDVWDFAGTTTARLQIAEYAPYTYTDPMNTPLDPSDDVIDPASGPNWAAGQTITLRNGGKNYAWTYNQISLAAFAGKKITYRFVLESGSGSVVRRYYVDDIRIDNQGGRTFTVCSVSKDTCGNYWGLNFPEQKADFLTSGRWQITSTRAVNDSSPAMAFDLASESGDQYVNFGSTEQGNGTTIASGDVRVHFIEFNGTVNFSGINADGTGGAKDWENDDGYPLLSFYHDYDIDSGESLRVQYTRDAIDSTPDNWTDVAILVPSGPASRSMEKTEVELKNIPNWNTQPFRLRFAMTVDRWNNNDRGWYIDNIALERQGVPRFSNYPFCENAENNEIATAQWLYGGQWGVQAGGVFGSLLTFTDSPNANYLHGQQTSLELRYPFDFNNDTPEHFNAPFVGNVDCFGAPSGPASRPILSFWHYRRVAANEAMRVEMFRLASSTGTTAINPTSVWSYDYNSRTRDQVGWERVEVDLDQAIRALTGQTLAQLAANGDPRDDDFYFQITLDARSSTSVSDGIYIDDINVKNYAETTHRLWNSTTTYTPPAGAPAGGNGNGPRFLDTVDTPFEWWLRFNTGADWAGINYDAHSGARSFQDSPPDGATYRHDTYSVLEMNRIIDLRGTKRTDNPTLYFWNHYDVGDDDVIRVQIAEQTDADYTANTRNRQGYEYLYQWGSNSTYSSGTSWQTVWQRTEWSRVDTWIREQIDLRPYADDPTTTANEGRRIKIRFVTDALDGGSGLRDGWYIDDIEAVFRDPEVENFPFFDKAQNTQNWIMEGSWGLSPDYFKGSGGDQASLGPNNWQVYWIDCLQWMLNPNRTAPSTGDTNAITCSISQAGTLLNYTGFPRTQAGTSGYFSARPAWTIPDRRLFDTPTSIVNEFGSTGRPAGAPAGTAGTTWDNYYVARMLRDITVIDGEYTFITTSDDAVRLGYGLGANAPTSWNIINNWNSHPRAVDMVTVNLSAGDYLLVMEYYERDGSAVINLQIGNNQFSFSDSPKAGAGDTYPAVYSTPYGNSSMMMRGVIDLTPPTGSAPGSWNPRMQYFTYYDLGASAAARVEVTIDGGFAWTQNNLSNNCPAGLPSGQCNPTIWGTSNWLPIPVGGNPGRDWQARSHDLRSYLNRTIAIRFRLSTQSDVRDGWWVTWIEVNE